MKIKFMAITELSMQLAAVTRNGDALRYAKDATEAVQLAAVTRNGYALQYAKDATEAVQLAAVKEDGYALQYVLVKKLFVKLANEMNIEIEL